MNKFTLGSGKSDEELVDRAILRMAKEHLPTEMALRWRPGRREAVSDQNSHTPCNDALDNNTLYRTEAP